MDAIERLAKRLTKEGFDDDGAVGVTEIARFIYDDYLPSQLLGMAGAAEYLGLASSNTLSMRLGRGHDLLIVAHLAKDRLTTRDACDAYLELHPKPTLVSDDVHQEAS